MFQQYGARTCTVHVLLNYTGICTVSREHNIVEAALAIRSLDLFPVKRV